MVSVGHLDAYIPACVKHVRQTILVNQGTGKSGWKKSQNQDIRKKSMQIAKLTMQN